LRFGVVAFMVIFSVAVFLQFIVGDGRQVVLGGGGFTFNIVASSDYQAMREQPGVSTLGVAFFPLLTFSVISFTSFWFYRLFNYYAQGHFFGDEVMRCYMMILWTRVIDLLYTSFYEALIWLFHPNQAELDPRISFDAKAFFTLLVLFIIVYILKLANQLDKENQEFV
jgi:hypothetical protein